MSAVKTRKKSRRKIPTKQGFPDEVGYKKPPKNRQFGKEGGNPRHSGAWKKEDTLRYKLEKLINGLDDGELEEVLNDPKTSPGVRRLATLLYRSNYEKPESEWRVWESAMNQAYGLPKQSIEQTNLEPPVSLSPRSAPLCPRSASGKVACDFDRADTGSQARSATEPGLRAKGVGATDEGASEAKTRRSRQTGARNTLPKGAKSAPARLRVAHKVRKAQDGAAEADA